MVLLYVCASYNRYIYIHKKQTHVLVSVNFFNTIILVHRVNFDHVMQLNKLKEGMREKRA